MSRQSARRLAHLAAVVALALGLLAGCGEDRATGASVRGLVILSGDVGATRLTLHTTADGEPQRSEVPDDATAWISGGPGGLLVATLANGRLTVRDVEGDDAGDWRFVTPTDPAQRTAPLLFGTVSPNGKLVASLTLASADQFGVAISDVKSGKTLNIPVAGAPMLSSPAWIDDGRVGIAAVDEDLGGAVSVVAVASGDVIGGPGDVRAMAVSADGTSAAWVSTVDDRLYVSNARSWLVGDAAGATPVEAPSGTAPGSFALDGAGHRLAVTWEGEDGEFRQITVYALTSEGWTLSGRVDPPPGDPRAVVSWLR